MLIIITSAMRARLRIKRDFICDAVKISIIIENKRFLRGDMRKEQAGMQKLMFVILTLSLSRVTYDTAVCFESPASHMLITLITYDIVDYPYMCFICVQVKCATYYVNKRYLARKA